MKLVFTICSKFKLYLFLLESHLRFTVKFKERPRDFPYSSCPNTCIPFPMVNTPHGHSSDSPYPDNH